MKIAALLPLKERSTRLPNKNIKNLGNKPLFNHILEKLARSKHITEIVIFSSSNFYENYLTTLDEKIKHLKRDPRLDLDSTSINHVINDFIDLNDSNLVVLAHATSPFLKTEDIDECIEAVISGRYDSAYIGIEIRKFIQFLGRPLNYDIEKQLPSTTLLEPIIIEQGGLYVFHKENFNESNKRIGFHPFVKLVDHLVGHDIDTYIDFIIAEKFLEILQTKN